MYCIEILTQISAVLKAHDPALRSPAAHLYYCMTPEASEEGQSLDDTKVAEALAPIAVLVGA